MISNTFNYHRKYCKFQIIKEFMPVICYALFYSLPTNWKFEVYEKIFQVFLTLTSQRTINYWRLLIFYSSRFDVCERRHHQCYNSFCITCKRANFCLQKHAFKKSYKGHTLLQWKNKCILQGDEWLNHLAKCSTLVSLKSDSLMPKKETLSSEQTLFYGWLNSAY